MRLDPRLNRATLTVLGAALAAASLASPAAADHDRRYKGNPFGGPRFVRRVTFAPAPARSFVYVSRSSCGAPAVASFIGGLVLGSALANAAPPPPVYCAPPPPCAPPAPVYDYYDPYCNERFSSFDAYCSHLDSYRHPADVLVIDRDSDRCVAERYWDRGRWREREDWDDSRWRDRGDWNDGDQGQDWNH